MKLPRNVSSAALQTSLRRLGYEATRQRAPTCALQRGSTVNIMKWFRSTIRSG